MDSKKRTALQAFFALIQNANFKGFFTGKIYTGPVKQLCVPGLNCYSCPGAMGACPIGSLQNSLTALKFKFPFYVLGLLIFFGALFGRLICGFLCPFGFLQDLLFKIPFPKKIKSFKGDKLLRNLKYLVLIIMVIALPIILKLTPFFCKYLCPSGTLSGLILSFKNPELFSVLGGLFSWKAGVLLAIVTLSIIITRPFCKYLCPLGAFYAPFNKLSAFQISLKKNSCTGCKTCKNACDMLVDPSISPNSTECIRCGKCIAACPTGALTFSTIKKATVPKRGDCDL